MIEKKDVEKLASLARITIPDDQIEKVRKDIDTILAYVSQINEAHDLTSSEYNYNSGVKNFMREDTEPHESGKFTDVLLKSAPKSDKGYIEVKKIL